MRKRVRNDLIFCRYKMLHSASQNARQWAFESNNSIDVTWKNKACAKNCGGKVLDRKRISRFFTLNDTYSRFVCGKALKYLFFLIKRKMKS